jgi:uncharacterized protein
MALCPGGTASGFQESSNLGDTEFGKNTKIPTSQEVAQFGYDSLLSGKTVAVHGLQNKVLTMLPRILPRKLVAGIVAGAMK